MELVLDRKLSEKRIFPAIDILKSGTRRDDLLLTQEEAEAVDIVRKATNTLKPEESVEQILDLFARTRNNREFVEMRQADPLPLGELENGPRPVACKQERSALMTPCPGTDFIKKFPKNWISDSKASLANSCGYLCILTTPVLQA